MKNDLLLLIDELEKQCDYLDSEMKACLEDWDYLGAHNFKLALFHSENELRILKNLNNPNYDNISRLKGIIERMEKMKESGYMREGTDIKREGFKDLMIKSMNEELKKHKEKLNIVEKEKVVFRYDDDKLVKCFEKMIDGEIDQFELDAKDDGVVFYFSIIDSNLNIEVKTIEDEGQYHPLKTIVDSLRELQSLGFEVSEDLASKVIYDFDDTKVDSTLELLSRIYYEVFHLYGERTAEIKF